MLKVTLITDILIHERHNLVWSDDKYNYKLKTHFMILSLDLMWF